MDVGHTRLDKSAKLELMAVLGDLDGSHLASPVVDVLEQMMVDGSQVGQIEAAGWHAFDDALSHQLAFDEVEVAGIENAKFISENGSVWVEVRILSAHSAASGVTAARI